MTELDPLFCTKGAQVRLRRGARLDSSNGPVIAGPAQIVSTDASGNVLRSPDTGEPILIDNPRPAPVGELFRGGLNGRDQAAVRWIDGSWADVARTDLELVQAAPVDVVTDPMVKRSAEVRAAAEHVNAQHGKLAERVTNLESALAALCASTGQSNPLDRVTITPTGSAALAKAKAPPKAKTKPAGK